MIFLSTFENKIDAKGRVSVPAPFRAVLDAQQQPLIITRSLTNDHCLEGQGIQRLNQVVDVLDTMDSLSEDVQMLQAMLANAREMRPDSEGRIVLPEDFINIAQLSTNVMFVGVGRLFEMWNPEIYHARATEQRKHAREKGLPKLVLNPSSSGPSSNGWETS